MAKGKRLREKMADVLRRIATALPDTEVGVACEGTSLESTTVKVQGKAFLFVREKEARLKLSESQAEAEKLSAKKPAHYSIGAKGWALIRFDNDETPALELMTRWIEESYRAMSKKDSSKKSAMPATSSVKKTKKSGK